MSELQIDAAFPGGNINVERMEGDDVFLCQELRDTVGHWFYWYFRIRGAAGRNLKFNFTKGRVVGLRGPSVSRDDGWTWAWLSNEHKDRQSFEYSFADDEDDVRFSFGMPYQEEHLHRFLSKYAGDGRLKVEELCQTAAGRGAERLRLGCLGKDPHLRVAFTARHHACEMMANYAMEGIIEETLADSETGRWLSDRVEILMIPFVDKDGVEAGDQGKNRDPHDHCLDYEGDSLYPTVSAIKHFVPEWSNGKLVFALDLHCPGPWGEFHEVLMSPSRLRSADAWRYMERYLAVLERVQTGPLVFKLEDSQRFTTWDGSEKPKPSPMSFSKWARTFAGAKLSSAIEIPYANAGGKEVNQETSRAFGRDLAKALCVYLQERE